jgi:hypothetical protein
MKFSYDHPMTITLGPKPLSVVKVKHGVTEASLSDGRIVRLSLHLDGVKLVGDNLEIPHHVIVEVLDKPEFPIADVHEAVQ